MAVESRTVQMVPSDNALNPEPLKCYVAVPLNHLKDSVKPCEINQNLINWPFFNNYIKTRRWDKHINIFSEMFSSS